MGRPSVSEASRGPLGRAEGDALPLSRATARLWPPRLRLAAASPRELCFVGFWPARAPLVLTPALLVLSSLSWLAPTPADAPRNVVSLIFLGLALGLIWVNRPRRVEVRVLPRQRQLRSARGVEPLRERARWVLVAEQPPASPQLEYAAVLVDGERSWRLLESDDPAFLLRELGRVLTHWPGDVTCEWGLPSGVAPWAFQPRPPTASASDRGPPLFVRGTGAGRGLRWAMCGTTLFLVGDLGFLLLTASARVPSVHPLSVVLPVLTASCLITVTAAVLTRHSRLRVGGEWVQERRVFGLAQIQQRIPAGSVRGVYLVTASHSGQRHLLVDGSEGPLSLLVPAADAERLRAALELEVSRAPATPPSSALLERKFQAQS